MPTENKCGGGIAGSKNGGEMKKTGFTLVELLVTIIILGILAGIGIPQYTKTIEKGKMREAEANLYIMYMAEKMYKLDHPTTGYIDCSGALNDAGGCNTILEVEMTAQYFKDYKCTTTGTPATTFDCTATRNSGRYKDDCKPNIDETGELTKDGCP